MSLHSPLVHKVSENKSVVSLIGGPLKQFGVSLLQVLESFSLCFTIESLTTVFHDENLFLIICTRSSMCFLYFSVLLAKLGNFSAIISLNRPSNTFPFHTWKNSKDTCFVV